MKRKSSPDNGRKSELMDKDSPELTVADIAKMRPAREVLPDLVAAYERREIRYPGQRGKQKNPTKVSLNIRVSPEVVAFFKSKGKGWQTRIDQTLMAIVQAVKN